MGNPPVLDRALTKFFHSVFPILTNKGETITRVNGNVLFFAGILLQNF